MQWLGLCDNSAHTSSQAFKPEKIMKKIMFVFGTRPEAIKLCPLVIELKRRGSFEIVVCATAQHREMLDHILSMFSVVPDYDLNLMRGNQTIVEISSRMLIKTNMIMQKEKPDMVIVQGDTTTTFIAALVAYLNHVQVGHVEAGLRTYNKYSPFPEEINRRLTGVIADIHFAHTDWARKNLLSEGVSEEKITVTGNTVIDSLLWVRDKINKENIVYEELQGIDFSKKIILVTGHRREKFGQAFEDFCQALKMVASRYPDIEIVYPVHLNPNVKKPVNKILCGIRNIKLIDPLNYAPFISLMDKSYFIITDSGGIQEEAPSLGKPILVTRDTTERPEVLAAGASKLVGTEIDAIVRECEKLINDSEVYGKMSKIDNPYGDGRACDRIASGLENYFARQEKLIQ